MTKAGPAGAISVASAASAPPEDSATRVPITPTPTSVLTTQKSSATVTAPWRRRSAGATSLPARGVIEPLHHAARPAPSTADTARGAGNHQPAHRFGDYSWPPRRPPLRGRA